MVLIDGGSFQMGTDEESFPADGEGPVREITLDPFYIDATAVTNAQFAEFVEATGYVPDAERFGWSFVFAGLLSAKTAKRTAAGAAQAPWWRLVRGACWKWPEGRGSHLSSRMYHPVTHVSWHDAAAFARFEGKRLPTEAEWECAARGGLHQKKYAWGDEFMPDDRHMCNTWQGVFPHENTGDDGFVGTCPVRFFAPNAFGLYEVAGNVWEWCTDWFSPDYHVEGPRTNPTGPASGKTKLIRGGSYLCHESYCNRYRVAARTSNTPESSTGNIGFRCAKDA